MSREGRTVLADLSMQLFHQSPLLYQWPLTWRNADLDLRVALLEHGVGAAVIRMQMRVDDLVERLLTQVMMNQLLELSRVGDMARIDQRGCVSSHQQGV